jgi:hypothetical protein
LAPLQAAATCHCGSVRIALDPLPTEVTECNCSICRRYGVLWAYYSLNQVNFLEPTGLTDTYMWDDKSIAFHRCRACGCVTHWAPVDNSISRMGINARLLDAQALATARVRHLDGAVSEQYLD